MELDKKTIKSLGIKEQKWIRDKKYGAIIKNGKRIGPKPPRGSR